jgi:phenylacetate-CoA ligase
VLRTEEVRAAPEKYRVSMLRAHHAERTSGSTGTPLVVWWSATATRGWYALVEARLRGWHGISRHDRWAILGGRLVAAPQRRKPPFWVWNAPMHQLYLSSYHLSRDTVGDYLEALEAYQVRSVLAYPSAVAALARLALDAGLTGPKLEVVLTNAEPLSALQRSQITAVFGCPVRDSYGLAELVAAGSECEAGAMHLWPEVGLVEILDEAGQPVTPGQVGRLVATGLLNDAMALVRYDTGDLAALDPDPRPCACGRTLPRLLALEGRRDAVIVTPDGRHIGRLDPAFKADLPIREAQVAQVARALVEVRVVTGVGWTPAHAAALQAAVGDRLGPAMTVSVVSVAALPRTAAGKVRGVIVECEL